MLETDFSQKLSVHARKSLRKAGEIARETRCSAVEPEHLLLAIFMEDASLGSILMENLGFDSKLLDKIRLSEKIDASRALPRSRSVPLSSSLKNILRRAYFLASQFHYPYVGTEHLAYALFESEDEFIKNIFHTQKINDEKARAVLKSYLNFDHFPELSKILSMPENLLTKHKIAKGKRGSSTPYLDQYASDMATGEAYAGETLVGREKELDRIIQILTRKQKNNPLLIGEPGVGKTALVAALAKIIARDPRTHTLFGKRILALDMTLVVAGTNFRGEFEARLKEIIKEAAQARNVILFIDEIHTLIGAGNTSGGLDAANILKPALSRGEIQCIGATTFTEYKRHLEKDPALNRRFQTVQITEPTLEETKAILSQIKKSYEDFHNINLSQEIINLSCDLSARYITDRFFPDKALDIIDEASALAKQKREVPKIFQDILTLEKEHLTVKNLKDSLVQKENYDEAAAWHAQEKILAQKIAGLKNEQQKKQSKDARADVTAEHVLKTISHITRIPFAKLSEETPRQKISRLRAVLAQKLAGQKEAALSLEQTLSRSLSNVGDPARPLGSFLFLGPTGVGKTLAAKILAEEFFGDAKALIRLDMSEFMERHSVAQMLGAPAGYVGYGEGGKLTEAVRRRPHSVILFDEIEKAHPDIFNILLQILDAGTLTDAEGRAVSFKNALVILTSNIGTAAFTNSARIGFANQAGPNNLREQFDNLKQEVLTELKKEMKPELLARLNHTIVFNALSPETIQEIVILEMANLSERLKSQNISLKYSAALIKYLAQKSFSPEQGARLVQKNIEDLAERSIAEKLLEFPEKKSFRLSVKNDTVLCG